MKRETHMEDWRPFFLTCLIAGTVLTILGPYNSARMDLPLRWLFWTGLCFAGGLGAYLSDHVIKRWSVRLSPLQRAFAQSLGSTLTVFICFFALQVVLNGWPGARFFWLTPFYIWVIGFVVSIIAMLNDQRIEVSGHQDQRPALFERLKPGLRSAEIYALSSEDHYVRVHTSNGEDMILMRLSDAIKEASPLPGLQIHRSWWVAEQGVKQISKETGKLMITLKSGAKVPVSRSNAKSVREAGWV